jgi:predicted nucleic acid-binding Zn ribbon protein
MSQGKRPQQYEDSARFAWYGVAIMILLLVIINLFGC